MYRHFFVWCFLAIFLPAKGQDNWPKDRLLHALHVKQPDTTLIDIYNELAWPVYSYDNADSSLYYGIKAIVLSEKAGDLKRLCVAHRRVGITYSNIGELKKSVFHQEESYRLAEQLGFSRGMYLALNNIGVAYLNNELLNKALSFFLRSLKYLEGTKEYGDIARLYINCGTIYRRTGDQVKAKSYFLRAKHFADLSQNNDLIVTSKSNLASANRSLGLVDSARYYLAESKKAMDAHTPTQTKYNFYLTEALIHVAVAEHKEALRSLEYTRQFITGISDEITLLINVADQYKYLGNYDKALINYSKALELSEKNKMYDNLEFISLAISLIHDKRKNLPGYARIMKLYVTYRDSNEKINKAQEIIAQQLEFDYERKHVADSIRFEQKENIKNMELEVAAGRLNRAKLTRTLLFCILGLLLIFAFFINNRLRITKKQKRIIEEQKQIVELKNREIFDSINYAKRLQQAILPQLPDIQKHLELDLLYLPKDIIGGDFYFFDKHNGKTFIAVCDCTGHGIPGAIMSVVCHHALEKSIREFNLTDPAEILAKTRELIIDNLNAAQQNIRDGMDCSLLVFEDGTEKVKWAGAFNPLWILSGGVISEIKADKHSVSYYENLKSFTTHELNLKKDSLIYLFTDGYADQFGGPKSKKYKYKTLKNFLLSVAEKTPQDQAALLQRNFNSWKGALDQVDDVAIAIIKV